MLPIFAFCYIIFSDVQRLILFHRKVVIFMNNAVRTNSPAKVLLSKTMVVTLGVTLLILAGAFLTRGIYAMIANQPLTVCSSLYQIFGAGSVPIVNLITSIMTAAVFIMLSLGLFMSRMGAKTDPPSVAGLAFLKISLIIAIIYTAFAVIASLASVSVINYTDIEGYTGFINFSATGLFIFTFLFGLTAICCEIAFVRFCNSLMINLQHGQIAKKGPGLIFFASAIAIFTSLIAFCIKLFKLIAPPKDYIANINADKGAPGLNNAELIINCFNVIIFAGVFLMFICMAMMAGSYAIGADTILRASRMSSYSMGHTVTDPQNIPDFSNSANYNYNQSSDFAPFYNQKATYHSVNKNLYNGDVPPIPPAPEMPFKPRTTYPQQTQPTQQDNGGNTPPAN